MNLAPVTQNALGGEALPLRRRFRVVIPAFPAFNIYSRIARITTALGPICIATIADKTGGWDVEVIDENNFRRFGPRDKDGMPDHAALQAIRPADVVGFYGGLTSTIPRLYELARFYHRHGAVTLAGGQHFVGENIQDALNHDIQFIVIGEGEATIHAFLNALRRKEDPASIAGISFLRNGQLIQTPLREPLTDFDLLPVPDFSLLRYAKVSLYPVAWVRGCGMDCEFCTVKGRVRCPAPQYVMDQISSHVERHNARHFFVVDDLFGQNRKATLDLCRQLAEYQRTIRTRLDFTIQIRLDKARDTELLTAMRKAGINTVAIGFESPIPDELAAMHKHLRPEEMVTLSRLYRKAGFLVHGMFIFGYPLPPGAPHVALTIEARVKHFRRFIRQARIDTLQVLLPVPLPGTELTRRLVSQNRVFSRDMIGWEYYDGNFPLFKPDPPLTAEYMQVAIRKIMGRFYQFRYCFLIALNIIVFPALVFSLHNIRRGWRRWYRSWRNNLIRFGGWVILRRWTARFRKSEFTARLRQAHNALGAKG